MIRKPVAPPPNKALHFTVLGGLEVRTADGQLLDIGYAKLRGLLVYLAMAGTTQLRRDFLAEMFWPDMEAVQARQNLRRALFNLKTGLGTASDLLVASRDTVSLSPQYIALDAVAFTAANNPSAAEMARMAALYRNEFLAGFALPECPEFEDWLQMQREDLHRRALALLEQLSGNHEQSGDYGNALKYALRYTELEPWDEIAQRRVMRLYALSGQTGAALSQYENCVRVLKNELGVLPGDDTRSLAEQIRQGKFAPLPPAALAVAPKSIPAFVAERRQVTVLYCELALTDIDDPDDAMELLRKPQAACMEIIRQFSGHIVQTHSGGLLAYFGYPQAHEAAARRAVQAALAVTRITAAGIEIYAGVHTGLIVTGSDSSMPDTLGKTSKIAIKLRLGAPHCKVLISQNTQHIVSGYFDCARLGSQTVSGLARPLDTFEVMQESGARTRLDAADTLTPLAGRSAELTQLLSLWSTAERGIRQMMLIKGEAGIGKSRLLHTFKMRLANMPHAVRELHCFPEFSQSPFHPLIAMIEMLLGFEHGDFPETKFSKLVAYFETSYPTLAQEGVPLLALLLSLPLDARFRAPGLSPQKQNEQTLIILLAILKALATRQPVLLIVEDMQWIDHSSLELLNLFVAQDIKGAIHAVFTARPEFVAPWKYGSVPSMVLTPLAENDAAKIVTNISKDISPDMVRRIVERADGVPLFIEEMSKLASGDAQASIPITLQDLLAMRMDSLGAAKHTAQIAATLGRDFGPDLLGTVSTCTPATLTKNLAALLDAGLIVKTDTDSYQFKHALIQEAAYQSQTKTDRQAAHRHVAQALINSFPDMVETQPEVIAQHLSSGGKAAQSVEYWIKAGQRATQYSAFANAIEHFNSGLKLVTAMPLGKERDILETGLCLNLGTTFITANGYGSLEASQTFSLAFELSSHLGDNASLYQALWGMWLTSSSRVGHLLSSELAEKLLHMAEQNNDSLQLQQALYAMGNSLFWTGQLKKARAHFERGVNMYRPEQHATMVRHVGENLRISSGSLLSCVLWMQGNPDQARSVSQQTLDVARQIDHAYSLGYALSTASILNRWLMQVETSGQLALEAMALSQQHGFPLWLGLGASSHGWVLARQGQAAAGIAQIRQCIPAAKMLMSGTMVLLLAQLDEALVHLGQFDQALVELNETLAVVNEKDDRFFESEFHRLKGECLLALSPDNALEAEVCFNQARAVSGKQGAKSLELRATMNLAKLWQQQGKPAEAQRVLAIIYSAFTEGFDTPDLREAAKILQQLA